MKSPLQLNLVKFRLIRPTLLELKQAKQLNSDVINPTFMKVNMFSFVVTILEVLLNLLIFMK